MPGPAKMRVFVVSTVGASPAEPQATSVEAAYYAQEGDFTVFKDESHQPVYSVRNDHLISVTRADGADPIVAGFLDLAATARENGSAQGQIGWETSDTPGGRVYRKGYAVTIAMTGESLPSPS